MNRCLCDQNENLDTTQPCPQGTVGCLPIVGNPRSFSGLAAEGNRHLPQRKGSHRAAVWWYPRLGPNGPADRFLWGQGSWQGEGLRVSPGFFGHVGRWIGGFFFLAKLACLVEWLLPRCSDSGLRCDILQALL